MEEITPDLIAQLASRIYNEAPQGNAAPSPSAVPGEIPSSPASLPSHLGSIPVSISSLPHLSAIPRVPGAEPSEHSAAPSIPSFYESASIPAPVETMAPAPNSSAGISAFVQKIRRAQHAGVDPGMDVLGQDRYQRVFTSAAARTVGSSRPLDIPAIREDFPILRQRIHGQPLAWLDNAATTQKPQCVIDALSRFYEQDNSNIHRGAHTLAARATDAYEKAREKIQSFIGASSVKEIVFVRGTTEGINLITQTYGRKFLQPGDEVVLSMLEHHANIVPWQMMAKEKGATLRVIPVNDRGEIMLEDYEKILGPRTKVVALTQASNSLGTILPVAEMTHMAKRYGARVLIDGAQSVAHIPVNVQQMGCDFFVFSGHKIFGPTGIGAVYVNEEMHDILPPWQGGGNMIRNVTFEETTYADSPAKFEAGTPNIADAVGLGAALDYVNRLGLSNIAAYEHSLLEYATEGLSQVNGLRLIGTAREKVGVLSFVLPNRRTEDVGRLLDQEGIAVRAGHHCSQPSLRRFGVETTVRPSLSIYNTTGEIDRLVDALKRIQHISTR
ncbi:MAG TPA: SufS family cysteine desulfurase [Pirellulales bacterium]